MVMAKTLMDQHRHLAIELSRRNDRKGNPKDVALIRFGEGTMRIRRESPRTVDREFVVRDDINVAAVALMFRESFFSILDSADNALLEIINATRTKEQRMNKIDVKTASTQELLAFYNDNLPEGVAKVKRFATRATAERRCQKLMDAPSTPTATEKKTKPTATEKKAKPAATEKKAKQKRTLADGVKASWSDAKVAKARSTKTKVKVGGEIYRSVCAAFLKLKLPMAKHIAVRKLLKEQGRVTFEGHVFTTVKED